MQLTPRRLFLVHALLVTAVLVGPVPTAHAGDGRKQVLVLFGASRGATLVVLIERRLPSLLNHGMTEGVDYHSEFIDVQSFADPDYRIAYRDFLRQRYKGQRIDLIIAVSDPALEFMATYRETLFPGTPLVFYLLTPPDTRLANSTGLVNEIHFTPSLDLAAALQPDLKHVYVVSGAAPTDQTVEQQARREFLPLERRLDLTYLSGLATRDLEARLKALPPRSAVFVLLVTKDGAGEPFQQIDYLSRVASVANAPTYSWMDASVDAGFVGGVRRDQLAETSAIAALALRVLQGLRADDIPLASLNLDVHQVDSRQLRRWGISEARVPTGTTILFREPSIWDRYWRYIIGSLFLMLAQAILIVGLLVQRSMLRRAGEGLRASQAQLRASYDRISQLGRKLLGAQETERAFVARELHDDINQQLALLSIDLDLIHPNRRRPNDAERLNRAIVRAHRISTSVHQLSRRLHPAHLQLIGLVPAIENLQREFSRAHQVLAFSHQDVPTGIEPEIALSVFRVAQEGLNNAAKHSGAAHVWVDLTGDLATLTLTITDDGAGFDVERMSSEGLGLTSMKERLESVGGSLEIRSTPGSGTCVTATVPIRAALTTRSGATLSA
jgi:signal transduction histidine kinase